MLDSSLVQEGKMKNTFWNLAAIVVIVASAFIVKNELGYNSSRDIPVIPAYIALTDRQQKLSPDQIRVLTLQLEYLEKEFSIGIVSRLHTASEDAQLWKKGPERRLQILGFDQLGMNNGALAELWSEKFYPKQWIKGNLRNVIYSKNSLKTDIYGKEQYRAGDADKLNHDILLYGLHPGEIDNKLTYKAHKENLDWIFSHELGHCNDWIGGTYLLPLERIEFLVEVTKAYKTPGSFRDLFGYVESITNNDKRIQEYYRVTEWWGTLCEWYFTFPDSLKRSSEKDFMLVDKWVKKRDQQYDTKKSQKMRGLLLKKYVEKSGRFSEN